MNTGGDAADQMVKEGLEITEAAVKLSALGAKNLAAIALALAQDNPKVRGKTSIDRLLKEGKELKVFPLKASDMRQFKQKAMQYGVLFAAIKEKDGDLAEILCKAQDTAKLNRIFERMGYAPPQAKVVERKKDPTRLPHENSCGMRGKCVPQANQTISEQKPSVKEVIDKIRQAAPGILPGKEKPSREEQQRP